MAYYRIKPRWRETKLKTPPATEALRVVLPEWQLGHIDIYELDFPFVEYIRRLNNLNDNGKAWRLISAPQGGIFNYTRKLDGSVDSLWYENGRKPFLNTVGFDGNVVKVTDVQNGLALVESIDATKYVPLYSYQDRPDLVHQFTMVTKQGRLYKAGGGVTIYSPLLTRYPSALPIDILEPFPSLPLNVIVQWPAGLNLRKTPGINGEKVRAFPQGAQISITDYFPRGAEVWARVFGGGYVCLYTPTQLNPFSTTWSMVTSPPPL